MRNLMRHTVLHLVATAALVGAALPASAAEICGDLKQLSSVEMTFDRSGRPAVPVMIAGKPTTLLLDTGGVISTLTQDTVEEFGLTPVRRDDIVLYDVGGNRLDRSVTLPSLTVGQVRGTSWRFWIHPRGHTLGETPDGRIAGLLAPDVLSQFDVDLDFARKTVKLFSPDHCEGRILYWTPSALAVIPMEVDPSGHITVPVTIDGQRLRALIDTGASATVMNLTVARRRFGLNETTTNSGPSVHQFKTLELNPLAVENPIIRLLPDRMAEAMPFNLGGVTSETRRVLPDVIIGQNILGKLHVYIAYRERKLYVTD
jgi:predicted aspartyl protease